MLNSFLLKLFNPKKALKEEVVDVSALKEKLARLAKEHNNPQVRTDAAAQLKLLIKAGNKDSS